LKATISSSVIPQPADPANSEELIETTSVPFQCDLVITAFDGTLALTQQVIQEIQFIGSGPVNGESFTLLNTFFDPNDLRFKNGFRVQVDCHRTDAGFVERFFNSWSDSVPLNFDSKGQVSHSLFYLI
jgi:hypothetical protein